MMIDIVPMLMYEKGLGPEKKKKRQLLLHGSLIHLATRHSRESMCSHQAPVLQQIENLTGLKQP